MCLRLKIPAEAVRIRLWHSASCFGGAKGGSSAPTRWPKRQGARPAPEIESPAGRGVGYLGPALAWAVVFADLGTSVYYVPAILYAQVGGLAPMFVLVATVAFVFVALEHLEIARRYPKGGGGVPAASEAFGPRVGVVSGALMVSAYLLTIAISVVRRCTTSR